MINVALYLCLSTTMQGHPYDIAVKQLMASFVNDSSGYKSQKDPIQIQTKTLGAVAGSAVEDFTLGIEVGFTKVMAMLAHVEIQTVNWEPGVPPPTQGN